MFTFKDCYVDFDGKQLIIGNSAVERTLLVSNAGIASLRALDKTGSNLWENDGNAVWICMPFAADRVEFACGTDDNGGLSEAFLKADLTWTNAGGAKLTRSYSLFPELPFIAMAMTAENIAAYEAAAENTVSQGIEVDSGKTAAIAQADAIDSLPMPAGHYKIKCVVLADKSDHNDALVRETEHQVYYSGWGCEWDEGNIFILNDYVRDRAAMLVKDAPANMSEQNRTQKDLMIRPGLGAQLVGTGLNGTTSQGPLPGHGSVIGFGKKDQLPGLFRKFYRAVWARKHPAKVMSNTWGDRNRDAAVGHDFMIREIECAARIGVDVVQIDDGWQKGRSANSALQKGGVWEGYYAADPDFWTVDQGKFPYGLKPLADLAKSHGIEMGLWFSPDSTNDFTNWRRDADTLLGLWREYGVCHFKLDGVNLCSKQGEQNYLNLMKAVCAESGNAVSLNQDITAQIRLGGQYFRQYGNLFVENRYTDTTAYYPHRTLKNLWTLSKYIPAPKMQFELLNPRRNDHRYPADDPFRPNLYSEDYLFASVMFASPLVWMEMSHLNETDTEDLRRIVSIRREHQNDIAKCDIQPIGSEPDGLSLTGFLADGGSFGYLLALRENGPEDRFDEIPLLRKCSKLTLLTSNGESEFALTPDGLRIQGILKQKRSYALLRWEA